jgi:peptidoglycan-associated lipoprotein
MKKIAVILFALMIAACNSTPKKDNPQISQSVTNNTATSSAGTQNQDQTQTQVNSLPQNQSIYFEYAKSAVSPEFQESIQKEAQSIKSGKNTTVTVEGNCDERGSAEYNLGLGQRRADTVKKLLLAAGVHAKQIKTTSLGKEKPKLTCHEEKCWKENRRVDFAQGS